MPADFADDTPTAASSNAIQYLGATCNSSAAFL